MVCLQCLHSTNPWMGWVFWLGFWLDSLGDEWCFSGDFEGERPKVGLGWIGW